MFGETLKNLREQHNLSQDELAKIIKVSKSTIGMYELGKRMPKKDTVLKDIAHYFSVSIDYLLGFDEIETHYTLQEEKIIRKYRALSLEGKEKLETYANDLLDNPKYVIKTNLDRTVFGHKTVSRAAAAPDVTTTVDKRKNKRRHT